MTVTQVFGEDKEVSNLKGITFSKYIDSSGDLDETGRIPAEYDNVLLLTRGINYDVMYAYQNGDEKGGFVYLGHWNDGVVK